MLIASSSPRRNRKSCALSDGPMPDFIPELGSAPSAFLRRYIITSSRTSGVIVFRSLSGGLAKRPCGSPINRLESFYARSEPNAEIANVPRMTAKPSCLMASMLVPASFRPPQKHGTGTDCRLRNPARNPSNRRHSQSRRVLTPKWSLPARRSVKSEFPGRLSAGIFDHTKMGDQRNASSKAQLRRRFRMLLIASRSENARKFLDPVRTPEYLNALRGTISAHPLQPLTIAT